MQIEAWLKVKATRSRWGQVYRDPHPCAGQVVIEGIKAIGVYQAKPSLATDELTFKIDIDLDESWFLDGTATITASIPAPPKSNNIPAKVDVPVKGRAPNNQAISAMHGTP